MTTQSSPVITDMKVIPVAGHDSMLLNIGGAHNAYFTRNIVVLTDNAGHTGIGEAPGGEVIYQTLVEAIPMVLGQEVARLNKVVQQVHKGNQAADFDAFGKGAWTFELRVNAVAALEAALLDLLGQALNVPVCELLGPGKQRDAITVLGYLFYIGDRTKTDLPYLENTPGNHEWYQLRHQKAMNSEAVVRLGVEFYSNKDEFEKYLEIKGNDDHSKLITMLEDVNDYGIPIEEVIDKHFDMENLTYYLAFNILTGNYDTQSRNSYLYSPLNEDTWYFYLWDLDTIFRKDENDILGRIEAGSWERGISNYWGNVLFQRCLKSGEFRDALDSAILDVKDYLSREKLQGMVEEYSSIVNPYLFTEPDISQVLVTEEENKEIAEKLPDLVDEYYRQYKESFEKPMPFYIGTPEKSGVRMNYFWDASYDFDQEDIS